MILQTRYLFPARLSRVCRGAVCCKLFLSGVEGLPAEYPRIARKRYALCAMRYANSVLSTWLHCKRPGQ